MAEKTSSEGGEVVINVPKEPEALDPKQSAKAFVVKDGKDEENMRCCCGGAHSRRTKIYFSRNALSLASASSCQSLSHGVSRPCTQEGLI
ncbi:hypothetical protein V6N12_067217 [Hibiscus sabdariffa]|uniref:Uncharacterized protein n=1 Tax=Hibiscus sabdariffa TaxID=183260 RepID=A0ABR2BDN1_9ROSI